MRSGLISPFSCLHCYSLKGKKKGFWSQFVTVNALGVALTPLCKSFILRLGLKPTSAILLPLASQKLGAAWARVADQ